MKGAVLALLCAAALVSAELNENGCPINPYVDILKPHPICNKFYQCVQGELIERKCASDLTFNEETQECDWAVNVDCGERPVAPESKEDSGNDSNANGNSNESGNNSNSKGDSSKEDSENNSSSNESEINTGSNSSSNEHDSDSNNNGSGNGKPGEAEEICSRKDSNGVLVPHEDCDKFYKCAYGVPVALFCNSGLLYNIEKEYCDWPENVNCKNRNQGGNGDNDNDNNSGHGDADKDDDEADKDEGNNDNNNNNNENGNGDNDNNNNSGNGNADKDDDETDKDEGNNDHNNNNNGNGNPAEAPKICARKGSDGVLVAHENCNQFYKCSEGVPVALSCNLNLLYNYKTEQCDWPENVNCESRNQGGNGDNDNNNNNGHGDADKDDDEADKDEGNNDNNNNNNENGHGDNDNNNNSGNGNADKDGDEAEKDEGNNDHNNNNNNGNGNPAEAPKICARKGSDGVLVAHENCNQFYKCSEGVPVALSCNLNLLYNIEKEYCDWPENVNCEGRHGGKGNDNHSENGEADKEDEETNGGDENVGGNSDPSQALVICAKEGSDSALVAHENCNQLYVCRDGLPLTLDCNPNLVYNPVSSSCDWPENVDCGTRRVSTSLNKHVMRFVKQFA